MICSMLFGCPFAQYFVTPDATTRCTDAAAARIVKPAKAGLLSLLVSDFESSAPDIDEAPDSGSPADYVARLAEEGQTVPRTNG